MLAKLSRYFDPLADGAKLESLPGGAKTRRFLTDLLLTLGIPFNRWLGFQVIQLSPQCVKVSSPDRVRRRNHVGTAHACALATMAEYAAGLVVGQRFPLKDFRIIIAKLEIDYHKPGRGSLVATAEAPSVWPEIPDASASDSGERFALVPMVSTVRNEAGEDVATCRTLWQVKAWTAVRSG